MKNCAPAYLIRLLAFAVSLHLLSLFPVNAERLSFTEYSLTNGLVNDYVTKIYPDSHGFLWFCTNDGLSRFDGYKFKNYTQDDGLPHRGINDFLETQNGKYLVATTNGIAVFNPNGKTYRWNIIEGKLEQNSAEPPLFKTYFPPDDPKASSNKTVIALSQDSAGNIFSITRNSFFRILQIGEEISFEKIEYPEWKNTNFEFNAILPDKQGGLWIAASNAIFRLPKDGKLVKIHEMGGNSLFQDREGNIWVDSGGNDLGIRVFSFHDQEQNPVLTAAYSKKDGLPFNVFTNARAQTSNGNIYILSDGELAQFLPKAKDGEPKFKVFSHKNIATATVDKSGNFWLGTMGNGIYKHPLNGFQTFDERDGIPSEPITSIFGNQKGEVYFTSGKEFLSKVESDKFETLKFNEKINGRGERVTRLPIGKRRLLDSDSQRLVKFPATSFLQRLITNSAEKEIHHCQRFGV